MLTTAGMVAVINGVVIGACVGLAVAAVPIHAIAVPLVVGATAALATVSMERRHHRRASDAFRPEHIDRAATFVRSDDQ